MREVGNGEVVLDAEGPSQRTCPGLDDLFHHDRAEAVVLQHPGTAELLGHRQPDEAGLTGGEHRRAVDLTLRVPALARLVADVTLDEFANDLAERLVVFVVDVAVHVDSLCFEWMLWAPVDRPDGASESRRAGDCSRTSLSDRKSTRLNSSH